MKPSAIGMAMEWARELSKKEFNGHEQIVAEEIARGFTQVEKGRHPDVVLREVLSRVGERIQKGNQYPKTDNDEYPG